MISKTAPFAIIGHPFGKAGNVIGCNEAPQFLRKYGLLQALQNIDPRIVDLGDTEYQLSNIDKQQVEPLISPQEQIANNVAEVLFACRSLYKQTYSALSHGKKPLVIGGDHSLSIGSFPAFFDFAATNNNEPVGLLWIDTHADLNTPDTSPSKNIFGMSVAVLLGMLPGVLSTIGHKKPSLAANNLAYIGLRDVDPSEKERIKRLGILAYTIEDIDKYGVYKLIDNCITHITKNTAGFVASFDLDVCDPKIAPAIGTPIRGGLTYRESHLIMESLAEHREQLLGLEFVELNPSLDINNETILLSISLLASLAGKTIL